MKRTVKEHAQMMKWLTRPRDVFPDPSSMDQASLTEELEPGALKDEMLKDFDPSQETYEEYLRRKRLGERPFNMAEGGQLVAPSVDGLRPGYQGKGHNRWNLSADRKKALNEAAKVSTDGKYTTYDSLPKDRQLRNKISKLADNIQAKKTIIVGDSEARSKMKKAERLKILSKKLRTDMSSKQLKWIATNSAYYTNPNIMIRDFKEHFNIRGDLGKAAIFKDKTTLSTGVLDVGKNQRKINLPLNKHGTPEFKWKPGTQNRLFKIAIAQNNKAAAKRINTALANVHEDLSALRKKVYTDKLTVEESLKLLKKRDLNALRDFDMLPGQGSRTGSIKHIMSETQGFNPEHYQSFRILLTPFSNIENIVSFLDNPVIAEEFGLNAKQVKQVQEGWKSVSQGTKQVGAFVDEIDNIIGKKKFRKMFGNVIFEHDLSKQFGKNWKFLPRDYLLRGQVANQAFNEMKLKVYDSPIADKIAKYEAAYTAKDFKTANRLEKEIKALHSEFNRITDGYMKGYNTSFKDGKFTWNPTDSSEFSKKMVHRYDNPNIAINEFKKVTMDLNKLGTARQTVEGVDIFSKQQIQSIKGYETNIKNLLDQLCPRGGSASGGRIGFNTAGAVLGSGANCGRKHMNKLIKNGTGTTAERNLIRQVIKAGFDFAKGTGKFAVNLLNPKEFLKLKNWVGGPAIALMGAVETADVADRWIRQGIPIKEALGEKWTKFLMPRSLQEYQVEGMEEANALSSPASKRYAKGIKLSNDLVRAYDQLEMLEAGEASKLRKTGDVERIAELKKLIRTKEKKYYDYLYQTDEKGNVLGDGELDFIKDHNEYRATTKKGRDFGLFKTSGRDFTDLGIFGGMNDWGTDKMSGLKVKRDYFPMYEIGTSKIPSEQELAFDATLAKEPFVRERLVPLPQLKDFKYQNKELPAQDRINLENALTEKGVLPPRTSLSEIPLPGGNTYDLLKDLTDDYNSIQKSTEARMYPAYSGSQFSEGGITTLRSKYEYKK